jgi:hypothetical protein
MTSNGNLPVADARVPTTAAATDGGGPVYAVLVATRLTEEEKRGNSLQARGLAVVTTSGTLVTLLIAIAKFGGSSEIPAKVQAVGPWLLAAAAVAFVAAAVGGLLANLPRVFVRPRLSDLEQRIKNDWAAPAGSAEKTVGLARARQLQELERGNDNAARAVLAAIAAEVLAIALAAAAVVVAMALR